MARLLETEILVAYLKICFSSFQHYKNVKSVKDRTWSFVLPLSLPATQCMWRKSPLKWWRRTAGQYRSWLVSHTACHCQAMSATWRRIFPQRSWSRTDLRQAGGTGLFETNPRALLACVKRKKNTNSTLMRKQIREKNKRMFFCF